MSRESWKTRPPGPRDMALLMALAVKRERERAGLTQEQLAERVSTTGLPWDRATAANTESGRRRLDLPELLALSAVLGIPVVDLIAPTSMGVEYVEEVGVSVGSVRQLLVGPEADGPKEPWPAADELLAAWQRKD